MKIATQIKDSYSKYTYISHVQGVTELIMLYDIQNIYHTTAVLIAVVDI